MAFDLLSFSSEAIHQATGLPVTVSGQPMMELCDPDKDVSLVRMDTKMVGNTCIKPNNHSPTASFCRQPPWKRWRASSAQCRRLRSDRPT